MKRRDFFFHLPDERIARYPLAERSASRLLVLDGATGQVSHRRFGDLQELLQPGDLLVLNNTRVLPARLLGHKASGGAVEVLVERCLDERMARVHLKSNRTVRTGARVWLEAPVAGLEPVEAEVTGRDHDLFLLRLCGPSAWPAVLESHGHMPLPHYMGRSDETLDRERYQTVFARHPGAVAAPTAGLHFDQSLLDALQGRGVQLAWVTLHVGTGTFQPVRAEDIRDHRMHAEWIDVPASTCEAVHRAHARGGRVVAVGTTAVRALESAAASGTLRAFSGDTDIFITPGYRFRVVDALVTNFHLPESTLLMLVAAFAGREAVLAAYEEAIRHQYRFYSYGDAMFVTRHGEAA